MEISFRLVLLDEWFELQIESVSVYVTDIPGGNVFLHSSETLEGMIDPL